MVLSDKKLSVYIKNGAGLKKENNKINILIYDESFFKEDEDFLSIIKNAFPNKEKIDITKSINFDPLSQINESCDNVILFDIEKYTKELHKVFSKIKRDYGNTYVGFFSNGKNKEDGLLKFEPFCDFFIKKPYSENEIIYSLQGCLDSKKVENVPIEKDYGPITDIDFLLKRLKKGFIIFDKEGIIKRCSSHYIKDTFDINPVGKKIQDILRLSLESHIVFQNWRDSVWDGKIPFEDMINFAPRFYEGKNKKYIKLDYVPIHNEKGDVIFVMCIASDKSKERKIEEIALAGEEYIKMMVEIFERPAEFIELINDCRHNFDVKKNYGQVDMNFFFQIIKKIRISFDDFKCDSIAIPLEKLEFVSEYYKDEVFSFEELPDDLEDAIKKCEISLNEFLKRYEIIEAQIKSTAELEVKSNELKFLNKRLEAYSIDLKKEVDEKTTALKDALEKISIQVSEKEKQVMTQQEFMASLGHEFRTPMNAILGFLGLLRETFQIENLKSKKELLNFIDSIEKASHSLLRLITNIMEFSKVDSGKLKLDYKIENLNSILKESLDLFLYEARRKNIELVFKIDEKFPEYLMFDGGKLRQILNNLLGNALKFTHDGKIELQMIILSKKEKKGKGLKSKLLFDNKKFIYEKNIDVEIKVMDTGKGIPKNQIRNIFLPFEQVEGQSFEKYGGTGLGLTITKGLVNALNGEIKVESKISRGSTFEIKFNNIDKYIFYEDEDSKFKDEKKGFDARYIKFQTSNILLIINSDLDRELLKKYMEPFQINYHFLIDGHNLIKFLKENNVDLIISDLVLPHLNGIELAQLKNKELETSKIPFICLSTGELFSRHPKSLNNMEKPELYSNFDSIMIKPISKREFIYELTKYLPYGNFNFHEKELENSNKLINMDNFEPGKILYREKLLKEIELEIESNYDSALKGILTVQEIDLFSKRLLKLSVEHNYKELSIWAKKIEEYVDQFDMQGIQEKLPELTDLFDKIKKM